VAHMKPVGASMEVLQHHADQHPCDADPVYLLCPCQKTFLVVCSECEEPVFLACKETETGDTCQHAEAYLPGGSGQDQSPDWISIDRPPGISQ